MLIRRLGRIERPNLYPGINPSSPQAAGLSFLWTPDANERQNPRLLVGGGLPSTPSSAYSGVGLRPSNGYGHVGTFPSAASGWVWRGADVTYAVPAVGTFAGWVYSEVPASGLTTSPAQLIFAALAAAAYPGGPAFTITVESGVLKCGWFAGADHRVSVSNAFGAGWRHIVCAWGLDCRVWVDGVLVGSRGSAPTTGNTVGGGANNTLCVGQLRFGSDADQQSWGNGYPNNLIAEIRIYNREMPSAEISTLYQPQTRWALYQPIARSAFVDLVGAANDTSLAASLTARGTTSAALSTSIALASQVTGRATVAGALTTSIPLATAVTGRASVAAALSTSLLLASSVTARGSVTSDLTTSLPLASAIVGRGSVTADLTAGSVGLDTAITGRASVTASLTTAISIASALQARATVTADLTAPGSGLTTTLQGRASVTASLTTGIAAAAVLVGRGSVAADLQTSIPLASVQTGRAAVAAQLSTSVALASAPMARVALTAGLTTGIPLGAQLAAVGRVVSDLTVNPVPVYGAIVLGATRAGVATFSARAGVSRPTVRTHLTE